VPSVSECAFALDDGWEDAWRFVRQKIRYIPYDGILKGSHGVLLSQEGNSLEKALLLARLLTEKGYAVRICATSLPPAKRPAFGDAVSAEDRDDASLPQELGIPTEVLRSLTAARSEEAKERQRLLLGRTEGRCAAIREFLTGTEPSLRAEKTHYYVRVATSVEDWLDLDPTLAEKPGQHVGDEEPQIYELSEIPENCFGTVTIRLFIQRGKNQAELLRFEERLSRLGMQPLQLGFVPDTFALKKELQATWESFAGAKRFVAALNAGGRISGRGQAATEYLAQIDTVMSFVGAIDSYSKIMTCMTAAIISPLAGVDVFLKDFLIYEENSLNCRVHAKLCVFADSKARLYEGEAESPLYVYRRRLFWYIPLPAPYKELETDRRSLLRKLLDGIFGATQTTQTVVTQTQAWVPSP
jgi:hypothetical protein